MVMMARRMVLGIQAKLALMIAAGSKAQMRKMMKRELTLRRDL
jgi:hypothetical protein